MKTKSIIDYIHKEVCSEHKRAMMSEDQPGVRSLIYKTIILIKHPVEIGIASGSIHVTSANNYGTRTHNTRNIFAL